MNSTKKNQLIPPLPLLDPKKTYTFFFSEHLQHENQTIEIITHELRSILKCNISYFLNEKEFSCGSINKALLGTSVKTFKPIILRIEEEQINNLLGN